jgi:hypothetical protein
MPSKKNKSGKYSKAMKKGMDNAKKSQMAFDTLKSWDMYTPTASTSQRESVARSIKMSAKEAEQYRGVSGRPIKRKTQDAPRPSSTYSRRQESDCADPNCRQCKEQRMREKVELPKYYTGLRVTVAGVEPRRKNATVINIQGAPPGYLAVCFDEPIAPDASEPMLEDLTKPGFGMLVQQAQVKIREDQKSFDTFRDIPGHIGVVVTETTRVDDVNFKTGQTGRLVIQPNGPESRVMINWNFPNKSFYDAAGSDDGYRMEIPTGEYTSCYSVPRQLLAFCRLDSGGRLQVTWPNSGGDEDAVFQKGEYVRAVLTDEQRITNGVRQFRIEPGTIMQYMGAVDRSKSQVSLAGGCDPAILGLTTVVSTRGLEKIEEEFIDTGGEVEITAEISFRKRGLKGMQAVVVLPMDQDGEIGLQFKEDIAAGSLDGHGEDKKCLYIHHSALKRVSG